MLRGVFDYDCLQALLERLFLFLHAEPVAAGDLVLHHSSHENSVEQLSKRIPADSSERRTDGRHKVPSGSVVETPPSVSVHLVLLPSSHELREVVLCCTPISSEERAGARVVDRHR